MYITPFVSLLVNKNMIQTLEIRGGGERGLNFHKPCTPLDSAENKLLAYQH